VPAEVLSEGRSAGCVRVEELGIAVVAADYYPSKESVGKGLVHQGIQGTEQIVG